MGSFDFFSPQTLQEACAALARDGGCLVAGGTDVLPQVHSGTITTGRLIDLSRLDELRYIRRSGSNIQIGALSTYADLLESSLLQREVTALVQAASVVGAPQTRQRGTLGGNIANASPAGDTLPPLLVFDAVVSLVSINGERQVPLSELLLGPSKTAMALHEVIHHVHFDIPPGDVRSIFLRIGSRQGMAISIASVAASAQVDVDGKVSQVRIALGAVAPTAMRCPDSEAFLAGYPLTSERIRKAADIAAGECTPIDDLRATATYRRHAVKVLVERALRSFTREEEPA